MALVRSPRHLAARGSLVRRGGVLCGLDIAGDRWAVSAQWAPNLALGALAEGAGALGTVELCLGARAVVAPGCLEPVSLALERRTAVFRPQSGVASASLLHYPPARRSHAGLSG